MQDGKDIDADQVVSGVGIFNTYQQLVSDNIREKYNFKAHLQKLNLLWVMVVYT